jgi:threonine synthase
VEQGKVLPEETVVACITGGGLKTQEAVADAVPPALQVKPTVESFEAALLERFGAKKPIPEPAG